jgi:hypothetical protein
MNFIGNLIYNIVPENWYQTKRVCDLVEKICGDPVLRNDIKITLAIVGAVIIAMAIAFCFYMVYRIKKLGNRFNG